jgi:hypothetical protein
MVDRHLQTLGVAEKYLIQKNALAYSAVTSLAVGKKVL